MASQGYGEDVSNVTGIEAEQRALCLLHALYGPESVRDGRDDLNHRDYLLRAPGGFWSSLDVKCDFTSLRTGRLAWEEWLHDPEPHKVPTKAGWGRNKQLDFVFYVQPFGGREGDWLGHWFDATLLREFIDLSLDAVGERFLTENERWYRFRLEDERARKLAEGWAIPLPFLLPCGAYLGSYILPPLPPSLYTHVLHVASSRRKQLNLE